MRRGFAAGLLLSALGAGAWAQYVPIVVGDLRLGTPKTQLAEVHRRACVPGARPPFEICRSTVVLGGVQVPVTLQFYDGMLDAVTGAVRVADRAPVMRALMQAMGRPRLGSDERPYWISSPRISTDPAITRYPHELTILPAGSDMSGLTDGRIVPGPDHFGFIALAELFRSRLLAQERANPTPPSGQRLFTIPADPANGRPATQAMLPPPPRSGRMRSAAEAFGPPPALPALPGTTTSNVGVAVREPPGPVAPVLQVGEFRLGMAAHRLPQHHRNHCLDVTDNLLEQRCYTATTLGGVHLSVMFIQKKGTVTEVAGHFAPEGFEAVTAALEKSMGPPNSRYRQARYWADKLPESQGGVESGSTLRVDQEGRLSVYGLDERRTDTGYLPRAPGRGVLVMSLPIVPRTR